MAISKIGSKALVDCSVAAVDIEDGSITSAKLAGSIANAKLANSSITVNGTSISLGASATLPAVSWQSVITADGSTGTTAVAGNGYFIDTTSAAHTITLPSSPSIGDTVAIKDYAGTFGTNNLTIARNSSNIQGVANDSLISTSRASLTLVYVDATKGWLYAVESNVANLEKKLYVTATGGTITTSGDYKIHAFTGDGCFVVSCGGNPAGSGSVDYLVVAGGGGASIGGGGGGGGGYRFGATACCAGLPVSATTYPITVGGGGTGGIVNPSACRQGGSGSPSIFSTITSAGGGAGGREGLAGSSGGSGGGGGFGDPGSGGPGAGNTPPVSPPQGNDGGGIVSPSRSGSGGGGAAGAGSPGNTPIGSTGGNGGAGSNAHVPTFGAAPQPFYSPDVTGPGTTSTGYMSGGGAGGGWYDTGGISSGGIGGGGRGGGNPPSTIVTAGRTNSGGGGGSEAAGAAGPQGCVAASHQGGKGIVLIRYKFQN